MPRTTGCRTPGASSAHGRAGLSAMTAAARAGASRSCAGRAGRGHPQDLEHSSSRTMSDGITKFDVEVPRAGVVSVAVRSSDGQRNRAVAHRPPADARRVPRETGLASSWITALSCRISAGHIGLFGRPRQHVQVGSGQEAHREEARRSRTAGDVLATTPSTDRPDRPNWSVVQSGLPTTVEGTPWALQAITNFGRAVRRRARSRIWRTPSSVACSSLRPRPRPRRPQRADRTGPDDEIAKLEAVHGPLHLDTLVLTDLATTHLAHGDPQMARSLGDRAAAIWEAAGRSPDGSSAP